MQLLEGIDIEALVWDWSFRSRPKQWVDVADPSLPPTVVLAGGRGSGKTLAGSNLILECVRRDPFRLALLGDTPNGVLRFALVARTAADVRVMISGESGIIASAPPSYRDSIQWIPSRRELLLPGAVGTTFSAEEPDQLRGPQFHLSWGDEIAAWKDRPGVDGLTAWENLRIATRLGPHPLVLATTTPKRTRAVRRLWADPLVQVRTMPTSENVYLARQYMELLDSLYSGTRIGAQELEGLLLEDVAGSLLAERTVSENRQTGPVSRFVSGMVRPVTVIGVDPSVAENPRDECGIVLATADAALPQMQRTAYLHDDLSLRGSPSAWGAAVVLAAAEHTAAGRAVSVVVEINQGGSLVKRVLAEESRAAGVAMPRVLEVSARRSKAVRAEPVVSAWERGRVVVVDSLPELEDQWTGWVPGESGYSPDRLDASVYALLPLLFEGVRGAGGMAAARVWGASRWPSVPLASAARHDWSRWRRVGGAG